MIRKITRGTITSKWEEQKTISCTITNPDKVIVILDYAGSYISLGSGQTASNPIDICLYSVSKSNIILYRSSYAKDPYDGNYMYSYQIIEFM